MRENLTIRRSKRERGREFDKIWFAQANVAAWKINFVNLQT